MIWYRLKELSELWQQGISWPKETTWKAWERRVIPRGWGSRWMWGNRTEKLRPPSSGGYGTHLTEVGSFDFSIVQQMIFLLKFLPGFLIPFNPLLINAGFPPEFFFPPLDWSQFSYRTMTTRDWTAGLGVGDEGKVVLKTKFICYAESSWIQQMSFIVESALHGMYSWRSSHLESRDIYSKNSIMVKNRGFVRLQISILSWTSCVTLRS